MPITESDLSAKLARLGLRTDAAVLSDTAAFLGLATGRNCGGGNEHDARCYHAKHGGTKGGGWSCQATAPMASEEPFALPSTQQLPLQ